MAKSGLSSPHFQGKTLLGPVGGEGPVGVVTAILTKRFFFLRELVKLISLLVLFHPSIINASCRLSQSFFGWC